MAITISELITPNFDTANVNTYTTASMTPTDQDSLLVVIAEVNDAAADDPGTINISSTLSNETFTEHQNVPWDTSTTITARLKLWTCVFSGAPGSGTITFDGMPDNVTGALWIVLEVRGHNTASPVVQSVSSFSDTTQTTSTLTFATAADTTNNRFIAAASKPAAEVLSAEAGWTAGTETSMSNPVTRLMAEWKVANDTSATFTWPTTGRRWAMVGLEIAAAPTVTTRFVSWVAEGFA